MRRFRSVASATTCLGNGVWRKVCIRLHVTTDVMADTQCASTATAHVLQAKEFGLDPVFTTHTKLFIRDVVNLESYAGEPGVLVRSQRVHVERKLLEVVRQPAQQNYMNSTLNLI